MKPSWVNSTFACAVAGVLSGGAAQADEAQKPIFDREIEYRDMTSAEHTAARKEARRRRYDQLTFCADPGKETTNS